MKNRQFPIVSVTPKAERALRGGHPWVYDAEITAVTGDIQNGCLADVASRKGAYLGTGLVSLESKIRLRILSDNANETFSPAFWERRLRYAVDYRRAVMGDDFGCCRLVFGEADELPGLTVDRFSDILVTQVLSYGIEMRKDMIYSLLIKILGEYGVDISGIYERNDAALREREGLELGKGWYEKYPHGETTHTVICENGIDFDVDFENGQKTGYFLDQKYNRLAVRRIAKGRRVLDCFTHTGSFALNAAKGGALKVTAADVSETAIAQARANAVRNGLEESIDFVCADVFELLTETEKNGGRPYDFIILDPPAFTKSRKTVASAQRGYKEINYRAMKILPRGGYLATCSCSHFMRSDLFEDMLSQAAADAGVRLKQIEVRQQCCDHPILRNVPETDYLKFYIFQVI
ncbi:MAG: class I SAM-dependent rRNA methyltransferase [Clostridia bacterium]|nr:class I SAM-dependent rRNA methyltransferase [Clostridia bacterium]